MTGLIQKSGYIKPGNGGGHYAEYIATREGVELLESPSSSHEGSGYLEYMAQRPRSHGLFSAGGPAGLEKTMEEINGHTGPVWTFVYSLKREDAHRLGYENSENWRKLLLAHQTELATAMKIPPGSFRWCAAFHDEKHHPHIHMMVWSADPKQGFLTEKGIEKMCSQLSNEIFRDELLSLYQKKDLSYQQVRDAAIEAMGRLIREMETGLCHSPVIAEQMETLAGMLEEHKGKKVYGYLKKPAKAQVDAIVDELAKVPEVAECYEQWNQLRDELERYYKDVPREHRPLSQQSEFKVVKNMVIQEAETLRQNVYTFEDARMRDEADEDQDAVYFAWNADWQMAEIYQSAKEVLEEYENPESEKAEQVQVLEQRWQRGFSLAAYQLGKLYLTGKDVPKDVPKAVAYLIESAEQGNQYAQYTLGKLYLTGQDVKQDRERAWEYFSQSAEQGNEYAAFFLEHFDQARRPNVFLSATRLLHHLGQIFRENSVPPAAPVGQHIDRKLRRKIQEKKIAMGHKPDDHEETPQQNMGGMTMGW